MTLANAVIKSINKTIADTSIQTTLMGVVTGNHPWPDIAEFAVRWFFRDCEIAYDREQEVTFFNSRAELDFFMSEWFKEEAATKSDGSHFEYECFEWDWGPVPFDYPRPVTA